MKTLALATLAVLLTVPAWADTPTVPRPKGPKIVVEPGGFDFGNALQQKTLQKEFLIRNLGSEDLVIEQVSTSCGCTVVEGYSKLVKPGGSTPLRVSLETRRAVGRLLKTVVIRSNDGAKKLYELRLEATVSGGSETK